MGLATGSSPRNAEAWCSCRTRAAACHAARRPAGARRAAQRRAASRRPLGAHLTGSCMRKVVRVWRPAWQQPAPRACDQWLSVLSAGGAGPVAAGSEAAPAGSGATAGSVTRTAACFAAGIRKNIDDLFGIVLLFGKTLIIPSRSTCFLLFGPAGDHQLHKDCVSIVFFCFFHNIHVGPPFSPVPERVVV